MSRSCEELLVFEERKIYSQTPMVDVDSIILDIDLRCAEYDHLEEASGYFVSIDYTIVRGEDGVLKPCVFELQPCDGSMVSALYCLKKSYNDPLFNERVKKKILEELGIAKLTTHDHNLASKVRQREILTEFGCDDLQVDYVVLDDVSGYDHHDYRYWNLIEGRNKKIKEFLDRNPSSDLVIKFSNASRGRGNIFLTKEEIAEQDDPIKFINSKVRAHDPNGEFLIERAIGHYKSRDGRNVTFRAVAFVGDDGSFRAIKKNAIIHISSDSHREEERYDFLERIISFGNGRAGFLEGKHTRLEEFVEEQFVRLGTAIKNIFSTGHERTLLRASQVKKGREIMAVKESITPSIKMTLKDYLQAMDEVFTERSYDVDLCCFSKTKKSSYLEGVQKALKSPLTSGGYEALNIAKDIFFNLLLEARNKGDNMGNIIAKLNYIGGSYTNIDARKGRYHLKKLMKIMMLESQGIDYHGRERKPEMAAFILENFTIEDIDNFIDQYDLFRKNRISSVGSAKDDFPTYEARVRSSELLTGNLELSLLPRY